MLTRTERRRAQRFPVSASARLLIGGVREGTGALLNVSEFGAAVASDLTARDGDAVVLYTEGFGRLTGRVVRSFSGGFAFEFTLTEIQTGSIRARIAALVAGKRYLRLSEKRKYTRKTYNLEAVARTDEEGDFPCTLLDISRSGCLIRAETRPGIGTEIQIGALRGTVVRHDPDSFAVQFAHLQANPAGETTRSRSLMPPSKEPEPGRRQTPARQAVPPPR